MAVAEGFAGGFDLGGAGAVLAGVVEAGAAVVGEVPGDEAEAVPAFDAGGVCVHLAGCLVEGEHAGIAEPFARGWGCGG